MRAIFGAVGVLCFGCADLDPLTIDTCGNQVLEHGEDCDSVVSDTLGPDLACGRPGEAAACRYVCSGGSKCPTDWGCGDDGVCRAPSAALDAPVTSTLAGQPQDVACGDFDGDGRPDVAARFPSHLDWLWGDGKGGFPSISRSATLPASGGIVAGDLDDDSRRDLVASSAQGLEVWRGFAARPPLPVAYAPFPLTGGDARVLPLRSALVQPEALALALFADGPGTGALIATFADGRQHHREGVEPARGIDELPPDIGVGDLNGDGTEDVALGFTGSSAVRLYAPEFDMIAVDWRLRPLAGAELVDVSSVRECEGCSAMLDGFVIDRGTFLADLDLDGELELLVSLKGPGGSRVAVAPRTSGGGFATPHLDARFASLAAKSDVPGVDSEAEPWPLALKSAGGSTLVVGGNGVYELTQGPSPKLCRILARSTPEPWTHAVVADLDGDQLLDVAAIAAGSPGVEVYRRAPDAQACAISGAFNSRSYGLPSGARRLAAGNLQGNDRSDLVVLTGVEESAVYPLWSVHHSWPKEPALATVFGPVTHLAVGRARYPGWPADYMDDLWVTSDDGTGTAGLGVLSSSGGEQLASPYVLYHSAASALPQHGTPRFVLEGRFFSPSSAGDGRGLVAFGETASGLPLAWPLPVRGNAQFTPSSSGVLLRSKIAPEFQLGCARFVAGDFDGDGRDEAAGVFGSALCADAAPGEQPGRLLSADFAALPSFALREHPLAVGPLVALASADLDGDARRDLVLVEADRVRVLWGGPAWLDGEAADVPLPPAAGAARAAAAVGAREADARRGLAIAAAQGIWLLTADAQHFVQLAPVADLVLERVEAADVDGDGLEDLIGISGLDLMTFRARPAPALGGP